MGGALPTAWAEPGEEATNQDAGAEAVDAEGAAGGEDLLVTIPGNHNKVMGCDADWAPDCAKAALTRDATGVYTATFTLPAGDYEYKVAEGGSWDASYEQRILSEGRDCGHLLLQPCASPRVE